MVDHLVDVIVEVDVIQKTMARKEVIYRNLEAVKEEVDNDEEVTIDDIVY